MFDTHSYRRTYWQGFRISYPKASLSAVPLSTLLLPYLRHLVIPTGANFWRVGEGQKKWKASSLKNCA